MSSRSFFNRSLISLSLTTHAAAFFAASSGRDLFFKRSDDEQTVVSDAQHSEEDTGEDSQPCNAATLNSSSGIESANSLANRERVLLSRAGAECLNCSISSSAAGGRYAWFFNASASEALGYFVDEDGVDDPATEGAVLFVKDDSDTFDSVRLRPPSAREENIDENEVDAGDPTSSTEGEGGVVGSSMPSSSPSSSTMSSSSVEGKKLRNRSSACHLDAFLNSTHTSIRPGRDNAGSRRSRWFVVL